MWLRSGLAPGWGVAHLTERIANWLVSGRASDGNPQGIDRESTDDERSEKDFGEHDDKQVLERE